MKHDPGIVRFIRTEVDSNQSVTVFRTIMIKKCSLYTIISCIECEFFSFRIGQGAIKAFFRIPGKGSAQQSLPLPSSCHLRLAHNPHP